MPNSTFFFALSGIGFGYKNFLRNLRKGVDNFIMIVIGFLGGLASGIYSMYLKFSNPDMTSTRLLIEYPQPLIYSIVAGVIFYIGYKIATNE